MNNLSLHLIYIRVQVLFLLFTKDFGQIELIQVIPALDSVVYVQKCLHCKKKKLVALPEWTTKITFLRLFYYSIFKI